MSCELCTAQLSGIVSTEKTITTITDTTIVTAKDFVPIELFIVNDSSTDTLLFRSNNESTWKTIYKGETAHFNKIYAKYLFLKAKNGSGIKTRLWAN